MGRGDGARPGGPKCEVAHAGARPAERLAKSPGERIRVAEGGQREAGGGAAGAVGAVAHASGHDGSFAGTTASAPPRRVCPIVATLYSLSLSHPSLAVRGMLRRKGIPHRVVQLVPGFHPVALRGLGFPGTTVPALVVDGRRIQGSREISRAASSSQA